MSNEHVLAAFNALDPREKLRPEVDIAAELAKEEIDEPDDQEKLDALLIAAWERMSARLRADRVEAWRRFQRTRTKAMARPVREFCIVLRANDTRMDHGWALGLPKGAIEERRAHTLWLDGGAIRHLTAPVVVRPPGVWWREAAAKLGMHRATFAYWVKHSPTLKVKYVRASYFGFRGKMTPLVWTDSPIDPCRPVGRRPHPLWGNLWQFLSTRIPNDVEMWARREPRWQKRDGGRRFVGWDFICPGRLNERGEATGCGRRVQVMYLPVPVQTIGMFLNDTEGFEVQGGDEGLAVRLAGRWHPGNGPAPVALATAAAAGASPATSGWMAFACETCWRPQHTLPGVPHRAWNLFVRTLSGGLLFGRDVPMPKGLFGDVKARRRKCGAAETDARRSEAEAHADARAKAALASPFSRTA